MTFRVCAASAKTAKDAAYIPDKQADLAHELYGQSYEDAAKIVLGDQEETGAGVYGMSAYDMREGGMPTVGAFCEEIKKRLSENKNISKIKFTSPSGVVYLGDVVKHIIDGTHPLDENQFNDLDNHIGTINNIVPTIKDKLFGSYGVPFAGRVDGKEGTYYVVFEVDPQSQKVFLITAMSRSQKAADNIINEKRKAYEAAKRKGKIDSRTRSKLNVGFPGKLCQSSFGISLQELIDKVKALVEDNRIYNQMVGEHANNAPLEKLAEAKKLYEEGDLFVWQIWGKTGWMLKADGKWRFEIPDRLDSIQFPKEQSFFAFYFLESIYDNPQLYEAYPDLKRIRVYTDGTNIKNTGTQGVTFFDNGKWCISISLAFIEKSEKHAKEVLVHEIQHIIQDYEGFAGGGNSRTVKAQISAEIGRHIQFIQSIPNSQGINWRHYDSVISDSFKKDSKYTEKDRLEAYAEQEKIEKEIGEETTRMLRLSTAQLKVLEESLKNDSSDFAYHRLLGEAEARETEDRADLKPEQKDSPDFGDYFCVVFGGKNFPYKINTYNQEQEGMYAGQYSEAENLIKIFRYANASLRSISLRAPRS